MAKKGQKTSADVKQKISKTDERVRKRSIKTSLALIGRKNPEHSIRMKEFYKENPEKHPNYIVSRNGHVTNIEKIFSNILDECFIHYQHNYHVGRFWIDFGLSDIKLGFECDGERWHTDKSKDIRRDEILSNKYGWNIVRFSGKEIINDPEYCKMVVRKEVMSRWLLTLQ